MDNCIERACPQMSTEQKQIGIQYHCIKLPDQKSVDTKRLEKSKLLIYDPRQLSASIMSMY